MSGDFRSRKKFDTRFPADSVLRVFRLLEGRGIPVWIDGGWGIDALLKRETREHLDLDLIIPGERLDFAESVLGELGFSRCTLTQMPTRLVLRNAEQLQVDIHPVTLKPDGSAEHIDIDDNTGKHYAFVHPAAGLSGVGIIGGRIVRCTTAAEQIRQRAERRYSPWKQTRIRESGASVDLEDIISLQQEFCIYEGELAPSATRPEGQLGDTVFGATEKFSLNRVARLSAEYTQLSAEYTKLKEKHAQLKEKHARLNATKASNAGRLTVPMRRAGNWLRRLTRL